LRSQTGLTRVEIIDRMVDTFRGLYGLQDSEITAEELALANELVTTKFGTEAWLQRVP
jgi:lipoate-protein ligase A